MHITDVLASKGSDTVITIAADASVQDLVDLLAEHRIGAAVVSDDGEHVLGIVSERDVVRLLGGRSELGTGLETSVRDVMTVEVSVCEADDSFEDLLLMMTEQRIRHVPVVRDGALIGLVSIGDAVKARMSDLEFERDQLNTYVSGG